MASVISVLSVSKNVASRATFYLKENKQKKTQKDTPYAKIEVEIFLIVH